MGEAVHRVEGHGSDVQIEGPGQGVPVGGFLRELHPRVPRVVLAAGESLERVSVSRKTRSLEDVGRGDALVAPKPARDHEAAGKRAGRPGDQVVVGSHAPALSRQPLEDRRDLDRDRRLEEVGDTVGVGASPGGDGGPDGGRIERLDGLDFGGDSPVSPSPPGSEARRLRGEDRSRSTKPRPHRPEPPAPTPGIARSETAQRSAQRPRFIECSPPGCSPQRSRYDRRMIEQLIRRVAAALGLLLLLFPGSGVAAEHGAAAERAPVVILLSFDGVRHDYLDRGGLPALERIARTGARAKSLTPVFPASTFPSHVALATGAHTDRHGIVGNRFHDPEKGDFDYSNDASFIEAEPIWAAAERQGVRSATFFWVGSETDWNGIGASYRRAPFDAGIGEAEKVDQILAWLDLPAEERPRLILSWWHGADAAGHRHGPDSKRTTAKLRGQDRQLARLLEGLDQRQAWSHTTLFVVSDHGMIGVTQGIDAMAPLEEGGDSRPGDSRSRLRPRLPGGSVPARGGRRRAFGRGRRPRLPGRSRTRAAPIPAPDANRRRGRPHRSASDLHQALEPGGRLAAGLASVRHRGGRPRLRPRRPPGDGRDLPRRGPGCRCGSGPPAGSRHRRGPDHLPPPGNRSPHPRRGKPDFGDRERHRRGLTLQRRDEQLVRRCQRRCVPREIARSCHAMALKRIILLLCAATLVLACGGDEETVEIEGGEVTFEAEGEGVRISGEQEGVGAIAGRVRRATRRFPTDSPRTFPSIRMRRWWPAWSPAPGGWSRCRPATTREVVAFYREKLVDEGWTLVRRWILGAQRVLPLEKEGQNGAVQISREADCHHHRYSPPEWVLGAERVRIPMARVHVEGGQRWR